ncbi:transglycosylase SLT domain-containing protein [Plastoroseomonas hellenica]|uniref:transglycosylase SLT domain-containing protein n=1 Tax=Plastoroseomonas hellenica TaxID=2687306 RepID=UPI001BA6147B|nr:transglycosylase SLT domain-containing protein [Plastoroseomonas hellenica]MBR0642010.1 lytic transglycosylase domain-containing protein [Plastoroseomonas hellenica]
MRLDRDGRGHRRTLRWIALLLLLAASASPAAAQDDPWSACRRAIAAAEPDSGLPSGLLLAIALVEAGRSDPRTGRLEPWPWSWNVEGEPGFAATRQAAVAEIEALLAAGRGSIDIGCMQVNLRHHPDAFRGPEEGFDPTANIRYAIGFLKALRARTGDWAGAIAAYHSGDDERGLAYHRRVALARLGAAWAAGGTVPLPARVTSGLCAPGLRPALTIRRPRAGVARPRLTCHRPGR